MCKILSVCLTVKTPVVANTAVPVPTPAAQDQLKTPVIVSVLFVILLALILAAFFLYRGYNKFR